MKPFRADAVYVNYSSDEGEDLLASAYTARTRERLVELKRKYDPTNFFRLNANIPDLGTGQLSMVKAATTSSVTIANDSVHTVESRHSIRKEGSHG